MHNELKFAAIKKTACTLNTAAFWYFISLPFADAEMRAC